MARIYPRHVILVQPDDKTCFLNDRISQDVDMVTLRINYRFGGYGAPVAARY